MPPRITNFLTQGIPSKIYLHCLAEPHTGYRLARELGSQTDKIYIWGNKMAKEGYLKKSAKGYESVVEPLLQQIKGSFQERNILLTSNENKILSALLRLPNFKGLYAFYHKRGFSESSNAVSLMCDLLSTSAIVAEIKRSINFPEFSEKQVLEIIRKSGSMSLNEGDYERILKTAQPVKNALSNISNKEAITGLDELFTADSIKMAFNSGVWMFLLLPNALLIKLSNISSFGEYLSLLFPLILGLAQTPILSNRIENQGEKQE